MSKSKSVVARRAFATLALAASFLAAGNAYSVTSVFCDVKKTGDTCRTDSIWQPNENTKMYLNVYAHVGDLVTYEITVTKRHASDLVIYRGSTDRNTGTITLVNPIGHGNLFGKITKYVAVKKDNPPATVLLWKL